MQAWGISGRGASCDVLGPSGNDGCERRARLDRRYVAACRLLNSDRPSRIDLDFTKEKLAYRLLSATKPLCQERLLAATGRDSRGNVRIGFNGLFHAPVFNPEVGTRQYPILARPRLPAKGYCPGMDTKAIGTRIKDARESRGLSQEDVEQVVGGGQSTISRIELGDWKRVPSVLPAIVKMLNLKLEDLDPELAGLPVAGPGSLVPRVLGDEDFKVYASAEGGPGEIILSTDPIEVIPRPSVVANIREAYGLIITGTSMFPEFRHGETAIVNPLLPFQPGEIHIFYAEREGAARATIKELRRQTADNWLVSQHNPPEGRPKDFALPRKEWRWVHRVLGKYSRR